MVGSVQMKLCEDLYQIFYVVEGVEKIIIKGGNGCYQNFLLSFRNILVMMSVQYWKRNLEVSGYGT